MIDPASKQERCVATASSTRRRSSTRAIRLVARLAIHRVSDRPARRRFRTSHVVPVGWRRGAAGELPREHQRRLAVVEPGRHVPHLHARRSAPSPATSFASIWCRARRSSARISSAICSGKSSRRTPAAVARPPRRHPPHRRQLRPHRPPAAARAAAAPVEIVFDDIRRRASVAAGRRRRRRAR